MALCTQTNQNKKFERVAKQPFQIFYWLWFDRKALYALTRMATATILQNTKTHRSFLLQSLGLCRSDRQSQIEYAE